LVDVTRRKLGLHVHERKVFCFGEIAFVRCMTCGDESLPWRVSSKTAKAWDEGHPQAMEEYLASQRQVRLLKKGDR
jgi:hypothetical protein